jgi:hypothetical protein
MLKKLMLAAVVAVSMLTAPVVMAQTCVPVATISVMLELSPTKVLATEDAKKFVLAANKVFGMNADTLAVDSLVIFEDKVNKLVYAYVINASGCKVFGGAMSPQDLANIEAEMAKL